LSQTTADNKKSLNLDHKIADPIFVTGFMHSATTLTQSVLGRHSQVFSGGGETRHFTHLSVLEAKYPDLNDDDVLRDYVIYLLRVICTGYGRTNIYHTDKDSLDVIESCGLGEEDVDQLFQIAANNRDHAALLSTAYDYLTTRSGKTRWLDKSPSYIMIVDDLLTRFPGAKVIMLVRDPRDILASKLRRSKKKGNYDPVWDTLSWRAAVRAGDSARMNYPEQVIRVRYEDMVVEPEREFRRICHFLDLPYEKGMLQVSWTNTSIEGLKGSGIGTGAMGKWRGTLPENDVFICQQLSKGEMAENNYFLEPISPGARLNSPIILGRSIGNLIARLRKKWMRGGKDHLLNGVNSYRMRLRALNKTDN
jgi:hypothetical protein